MNPTTCPNCGGRITVPARSTPERTTAIHEQTCPGVRKVKS